MSTLSTYDSYLSQKLSSSSENFWDITKRTNGINWALREFTDEYKPEELRRKATVTTAADADSDYLIASLPTGVTSAKNILKLWVPASETIFTYVDPETYYSLPSSNIWTVDYNETAATQKIHIKVSSITGTLKAHFIVDPEVLVDGSDDSNINYKADELIAIMAAEKLLTEAKDYESAAAMQMAKRDAVATWQGKYGNVTRRLKSKFERTGYHSRT